MQNQEAMCQGPSPKGGGLCVGAKPMVTLASASPVLARVSEPSERGSS
jgi:hypothetical protein